MITTEMIKQADNLTRCRYMQMIILGCAKYIKSDIIYLEGGK